MGELIISAQMTLAAAVSWAKARPDGHPAAAAQPTA